MVANASKELRASHTFDPKVSGVEALVRSAVVYGPNAAGKTNLLIALQFVQNLVVNSATWQQGNELPYAPFKFSPTSRNKPSRFQVTFIQDKVLYEYGVSADATRVYEEWLVAYPVGRPQRLFERRYEKRAYQWKFSTHLKGNRKVWKDATRPNALFLSTAVQLNNTQLIPVYEWFQKRLVVIAGNTKFNPALTVTLLDRRDGKEILLPFLHAADLGIADVDVLREPLVPGLAINGSRMLVAEPGKSPVLVRVTMLHQLGQKEESVVGLDFSEESSGTQALFLSAGAWLNVLDKAEVLLFDEIDTSLHPLITRFLVGMFNSKERNKLNAQLLFTTHDTSLLEDDFLRRDQVWFVEKNRDGQSELTPLTDFSPRKSEAIARGYLRGRYGALPIVREFVS